LVQLHSGLHANRLIAPRSPCPIREGQREYHCTTPRLRLFLKTLLRSKSGQWGIVVTRWDIRASPTHPYLSPPQFCFHAATESRIASCSRRFRAEALVY